MAEGNERVEVEQFNLDEAVPSIVGETEGFGPDVFLCHGLSATRSYVIHGSHALARGGYRVHTYDARGHGASGSAPPGEGYGYASLVDDLDRVVSLRGRNRRVVVGGHSMGSHTAAAWALKNPERVAALILVGPVFAGESTVAADDRWDARADALSEGGPEAFADEIARGFEDPKVVETVHRLAIERARKHSDRAAVARALREVPRSNPFGDLSELGSIGVPTLVVGSRDELDPGHPLATAEMWAQTIPDARLDVEAPGESPLAWQGGRLARSIADFLDEISDLDGRSPASPGASGSDEARI